VKHKGPEFIRFFEPIELVAGEDLIHLFENLELGLLPRKTFEIDRKFFDEFTRET